MSTAGLVLAAGAGRRLGGPKALLEVDGERLVDRAVRTLRSGGVDRVVVVAGAAPLDVPGADVVDNPGWAAGMGSSLQVGLDALADEVELAVVVVVDQPGLTPDAVRRLLTTAVPAGPGALAVATYAGARRHPVVLGRDHWAGVTSHARGDVGARPYLEQSENVVEVECGDVAGGDDLDSPEDLARLQR